MRALDLLRIALFATALHAIEIGAVETNGSPELGLSRIIRGWTNYSTAFNATHDTGSGGYATVASFYTPDKDVTPAEYGIIVIWNGSGGQHLTFTDFTFGVFVWSSLEAFTTEPRRGDVTNWYLPAPTGGNTTVSDTTTRGGRPAYEIRFSLTGSSLLLSNGHTYLVGFAARTDTLNSGELFVPTTSHEGSSDVQAGDIVPGGWTYLANAGGSTIYSGQLATELVVLPIIVRPRLQIRRLGPFVELAWPASADGFVLESATNVSASELWWPIEDDPVEENGVKHVVLSTTWSRQWYRLRR
jgi:hypothetical protein